MPDPLRPPVGLLVLRLRVPGARTLKDKRSVVRSILDRAASRHHVSVAEVGALDIPGEAIVAAVVVANERSHVQRRLDALEREIESNLAVEIVEKSHLDF